MQSVVCSQPALPGPQAHPIIGPFELWFPCLYNRALLLGSHLLRARTWTQETQPLSSQERLVLTSKSWVPSRKDRKLQKVSWKKWV